MDIMTKSSVFFRSIPVQWVKYEFGYNFFRSIPIHFLTKVALRISFPEHTHSLFDKSGAQNLFSGAYPFIHAIE